MKAGPSLPEATPRLATAEMWVVEGERTPGTESKGKEDKFHLEVRGSEKASLKLLLTPHDIGRAGWGEGTG